MRHSSLLLLGAAALGACAPVPPPAPNLEAQAELQQLLAGKVAGQPVSCLPPSRSDQMITIDDNTIAFRQGNTVYVNEIEGSGCSHLSTGFYTLLTRRSGNLCSGQIAQVADLNAGTTVGSCVLGDFVPYRPA
jgi:hypothetical protein